MVRLGWVLAGMMGLGAVAQAQSAPGQGSTVAQFQGLEDKWSVALAQKDQFALENLLLPSMVNISAGAQIDTRNQLIANTLAGLPEPLVSVEQKVVNVRVVSDVAIVEGTYVLRLKEDNRVRDERGVFTHVWQRARNTWGCVSAQRTSVVDQIESSRRGAERAGAADAGAQKNSDAEAPFHIPLLYKGAKTKTPAASAVGNPQP